MKSPKKFTFKNHPKETGLARVGAGTPAIGIKYAGAEVGAIYFNNSWSSNRDIGIQVRLMAPKESTHESPCKWKWITLKEKFSSGDEAKAFLNENFEKICKLIYVPEELQEK